MSLWLSYLVSALGASVLGSLVLWLLIGIAAGFSLSLFVSILMLSVIVIIPCTSILLLCLKPLALKLSQMPTVSTVRTTTLVGGLSYFTIYLVIIVFTNEKGLAGSFFRTGAFIFPLVVGLIYGCTFGLVYSKLRG